MSIKQAVILAGGPGIRLRPLTNDRPKAMVHVNGRPFIEYLFELLKGNGIREAVLLLGYLAEKVVEHVGDGSKFGMRVKYSVGSLRDSTGTRLRNAKSILEDRFLLLYCDNYVPLDLKKLQEFHEKSKTLATVTVYTNKDQSTKSNTFVDKNGLVANYDRSRLDPKVNGVELGFFIMEKSALDPLPKEDFWFEEVILPRLIEKKSLAAVTTDHPYYSIGTVERLKIMEKFLAPKKVIFLDRDGVINKKMPKGDYVKRWEEFEFLPGAIEAMKLLSLNGYGIYIVSNQAGIARGVMNEDDLKNIHKEMSVELAKHNIKISSFYYCPHGFDDGCECRKPKPGMLYQAARDHFIDLTKTFFVGDDPRDIEAGEAAGCKTTLLDPKTGLLGAVHSILKS